MFISQNLRKKIDYDFFFKGVKKCIEKRLRKGGEKKKKQTM